MSAGLAELTARAYGLVQAGDLSAAQLLLGDALAEADTDPRHASAALAEAAGLLSRVLVGLGEPHSARAWASFAYAAENRLYGPGHERTVRAAATLAAVLHRIGNHAEAAGLYGVVIEGLTALEGPESPQVLAAHADLATVEFARGDCATARTRLAEAWDMTREARGDADPAGIKMLARLGAMERDCGQFTEAHQHLSHARELCRVYLSPDHPMTAQVAALSRAAANPHHLCGGNALPAARDAAATSPAGDEEPVDRPQSPIPPDVADAWWPAESEPEPPANLPVHVPREPPRPHRRATRRGPAPLVVAGLVVAITGAIAVVAGLAAVDRQQEGAAPPPTSPSAAPSPSPSVSPAPSVSPSPSAARPGTPPTGVRLDDRRETIAISWTYPAGATGRVRLSGAPRGQQQRPFQELPAGATSYVVHGLDRGTDFCFTVAVVYSAKTVGRAKPVCTARNR